MLYKVEFSKSEFKNINECYNFMKLHDINMNEIKQKENPYNYVFIINKLEEGTRCLRFSMSKGVVFCFSSLDTTHNI